LPITENLTTTLAYNLTSEEYDYDRTCAPTTGPSPCIISPAIIDAITESPWVKSSVSAALQYNSIDDMKNPHAGIFANVTGEFAGLGGDASWAKITARGSYYHTLSEEQDIVGLLTAGGGHIQAVSNDLRVFDQFKSSDRIIRGFAYNGMGPVDRGPAPPVDPITGLPMETAADDYHLGGTTYLHASAEAQFPMPALPPSLGVKGAVFADAATLFGVDSGVRATRGASFDMKWRASVGVGVIWASPFGPIRIDYAIPVLKEDTDVVQNINFGISTKF
jgi:outer membrane protein insertion porin family